MINKVGHKIYCEVCGKGIIGVVFAIFIVLWLRGCALNDHQEDINSFCYSFNYEYGEETVRHTIIECKTLEGDVSISTYSNFTNWRDEQEELLKQSK